MKVYVIAKEVTYKSEKYTFIYDVYENFDNCYANFKELIENCIKEDNMFIDIDSDFQEGDTAVKLCTENYDEYTVFYIVDRNFVKEI